MRSNYKNFVLLLIGIASVILACAGYWFVYNSVVDNSRQNSLVMQEIDKDLESKKNEDNLLEIGKATELDRQRLSTFIISEDKILDLITSIEDVGNFSSTEIVISSILKDETGKYINIKVDVNGAWMNINKALVLIENLPYSLTIDYVQIALAEGKWKMNINVKALTTK
jgi:hypothetical protein